MSQETELIEKLTTLNHIAETLNRTADVHSMLDEALPHLVSLMGLETGWIFAKDTTDRVEGDGDYVFAAHHNLPPALDPGDPANWQPGCACQRHWAAAPGDEAYNVIQCSRLANAQGDRGGLAVHASAPMRSGDRILGILNVAVPNWDALSPQALSLLTNVGSQMGIALERARLYDLLRERRLQEQAALLEFSTQLLRRSTVDELIAYLVDQVCQTLRADACALVLPGDEPDFLAFEAASGWQTDPVLERRKVPAGGENGPAEVMRTQQPLLVEDIEAGAKPTWMPDWLRAEGFRGHAVVPLIAAGQSIGALVIDARQPRLLDENDLRFLQLMANQAALAIEKARLHQEEMKGQAMEKELEVGKQIQLSLMPKATPAAPGWDFAAYYQAARQVGGDFWDFFELPGEPGRLGGVIADVVGKGVPAALFMALSRTVIRTTALGGGSPSVVLRQANHVLQKDSLSELLLTALYAVLDTSTGRLTYASAGHNRPLWWHSATGAIDELATLGTVLGMLDDIELEERVIDLAPGDVLLFYTDGITEAMDANHRVFGTRRLRAAMAEAGAGAQQVLDSVVAAVCAFTGDAPQSDDITLIVVRRCPAGT